ncbi:MAG: hemolysin III family protein [Azospirillaceae bacterium]|nr:hemolysin III family protein [Azospirillaceae bacterium]
MIHMAGLALALTAGFMLLSAHSLSEGWPSGALGVYVACMVVMLAASAAYNLSAPGPAKAWLRRVDHAAIFAAIAGTYTPLLARLPAPYAALLSAGVWALALAGITLKLAAPGRHERLGLLCYIGLGWIGLPVFPMLAAALRSTTPPLIGLGAVLYTVGAGVQLMTRLRYHNAVWHILVLLAAGCHFLAIQTEFAP